jgi:hypothetical protein
MYIEKQKRKENTLFSKTTKLFVFITYFNAQKVAIAR